MVYNNSIIFMIYTFFWGGGVSYSYKQAKTLTKQNEMNQYK